MNTENRLSSLKGKTVSKLLVVLFAALLCSVLVLATADDSAAAVDDEFVYEGINYVVTSEEAFDAFDGTVKVGLNTTLVTVGDLTIPDQVTNEDASKTYSVTSIGDDAFNNADILSNVVIPDSVTSIGDDAFAGCTSIITLTMPIDIEIMEGMFSESNLMSVTLTAGQTGIGASYSSPFSDEGFKHTPWYMSSSNDLSLIIEDDVTSIGSYAFYQCYSLRSVIIGDDVITVGESAFSGCATVEISTTGRPMGGLNSVTIGDSVTTIGEQAFEQCDYIESIIIPKGVTVIGDYAFSGCSSLKNIDVSDENIVYSSVDGILYNKDKTELISCPLGYSPHDGKVTIPEGVVFIGNSAFSGCKGITDVIIPDSVTTIGEQAFMYCFNLAYVDIGDNLTSVGPWAFGFVSFHSSNGINTINYYDVSILRGHVYSDYDGIRLVQISYPNVTVGDYIYDLYETGSIETAMVKGPKTLDGSITELNIPANVVYESKTYKVASVDYSAFSGCSCLESITIPVGASVVDNSVFQNNESMIINVMDSDEIVYSWKFNGDYISEAEIFNAGISEVVPDADLEEAIINSANNVNPLVLNFVASGVLPKNALISYKVAGNYDEGTELSLFFYNEVTKQLEDQSQTVTVIDGFVTLSLTHCSSYVLSQNNILSSNTEIGNIAYDLNETDNTAIVLGLSTSGSSITSLDLIIPAIVIYNSINYEVTSINENAFESNKTITEVIMPDSVKIIGSHAFYNCIGLTEVTIGDYVEFIGDHAFYYCTSLESITIPDNVTTIGEDAFNWCTSLTEVNIGNGVTIIEAGVFVNCTSLESITIPDNVTTINESFNACSSLNEVIIGNGVTFIGQYAFGYCTSLESITIPDNVTTIYTCAFAFCDKLTDVIIGDGVISIGDFAFYKAPLTNVVIGSGVTSIGDGAFSECTFYSPNGTDVIADHDAASLAGHSFTGVDSSKLVLPSTIKFNLGDVTIKTLKFDYDSFVVAPSKPVKKSTHAYDFTFEWVGYEENVTKANGDITYYGEFTSVPKVYTITWIVDGAVVNEYTQIAAYDTTIVVPDTPTKSATVQYQIQTSVWTAEEGYAGDMLTISDDVTFTAVYDDLIFNQYAITFNDGTEDVFSESMKYGATIVAPTETPTKDSTDEFSYVFNVWTGFTEAMTVSGDATFNADFTATKRSYTITFNDGKTDVYSESLEYGKTINAPTETPTKDSTEEFSYLFKEWIGLTETPTVVGEATFNADFTATKRSYDVIYMNGDAELERISTLHGTTIVLREGLEKESTAEFEYTFAWAGYEEGMIVTEEVTFTADFTATKRSYTITFNDGKTDVYSESLEYGKTINAPTETPTKDSTDEFSYVFNVWTGFTEAMTVSGDATFNADFTATKRSYTITFNDGKTDVYSESLEYGKTINAPTETPTKDSTEEFSYLFKEWIGLTETPTVVGEATFNADFTATKRSYDVIYMNGDAELERISTLHGTTIVLREGLEKESTAEFEYTFAWAGYEEGMIVTEEVTFTADFTATKRSYTITFNDGKTDVYSESLEYGKTINAPTETPTKDSTDEFSYVFNVWTGFTEAMTVSGDATFNADFTATKRSYTITFNDGKTDVYSESLEYGKTINAPTETPTKDSTEEFSYLFKEWIGLTETPTVVGEATFNADFTATKRSYDVIYMNGDAELERISTLHGTTIVLREGLEKESTAEFEYTFAWAGYEEGMIVTEEVTFTADFTATKRSYTITWIVGTFTDTTTVSYGATPVYDSTVIAGEFTYSNIVWDVVVVTGPETYTAIIFDTAASVYTIDFKFGDITFKTQSLAYGNDIIAPGNLSKNSTTEFDYTFAWGDYAADMTVTGDKTFDGAFTEVTRLYTITWNVDGTETTEEVLYGILPEYSVTPTKVASAQYTYTFDDWDVTPVLVTGPATYTAEFTSEVNEYTVTWVVDGIETNKTETLKYGATPNYGDAPVTDQYTYTINSWSPAISNVTGDVTYTANYTTVTKEYTITWIVDGITENKTTQVAYGVLPAYGEAPVKAATDEFTYTFTGFTPTIVDVVGNATYAAQFSEATNKYTVTYMIGEITISSEEFDYNTVISPREDLVKDPTAAFSYEFEWEGYGLGMKVTKDEVFTAKFTQVDREYTITWIVDGIVEDKTTQVVYNGTPVYGDDPTKAADELNTYAFTGWSPVIASVTADATYTAVFEATAITYYTITWIVDGIETTTQVAEGVMPSYGSVDPTKAADEVNTYAFTGWNTVLVVATENVTYTAQFEAIPITYTITWKVDGIAVDKTTTVAKNQLPVYGDAPTKAADDEYTYAFAGWNPALVVATEDATYEVVFEPTAIVYYTITWVVFGFEDKTEQVVAGLMPSYGLVDPTRAADETNTYVFDVWDPEVVVAAANATYTAQWTVSPITYTITWVVEGMEDRVEEVAAGVMPSYGDDPVRAADETNTYVFDVWDPEVVVAAANATYTAQWTVSPIVYYTITWVVEGMEDRVEEVAAGVMPSYGDDPVRAADETNTYVFDVWDPEVVVAAANATYTAQFEAIPITYTITWVVEGITENVTTTAVKGELPVYGVDPTKDADEVNTYVFAGWNPALVVATEDAMYTAEFDELPIAYTMTWDVNGVETTTGPLGYGAEIIAPADPADYFNDRGNYTFLNWEGYVAGETTVDGNMTFVAVFDETLNTYTVVFKVGNITFKKVTLDYGAEIVAPAKIKKASTPQYNYTFEWVGYTAGDMVTGDETFNGEFTEVLRSYTITWMIEGVGTTSTVNYGVEPVYEGEIPTKEAVGEQTFTFDGWDVDPIAVTGPAMYTAEFVEDPMGPE